MEPPAVQIDSARLEAVAASWIGTPFRANAAIKSVGVCCHLLVTEILIEAGALRRKPFPRGNPNYSLTQRQSLIEDYMASSEDFVAIPLDNLKPGDLLGYRIGGCTHHLALLVSATKMVHAVRHNGVMFSRPDDPMWARRLTRAWRVKS